MSTGVWLRAERSPGAVTPMNRHRQFDWVASRNIGRQLGRAVDMPGVHPSERDASQLLRWRQRSSLTHAATPTAASSIAREFALALLFLP
jgi:hypothetical protein